MAFCCFAPILAFSPSKCFHSAARSVFPQNHLHSLTLTVLSCPQSKRKQNDSKVFPSEVRPIQRQIMLQKKTFFPSSSVQAFVWRISIFFQSFKFKSKNKFRTKKKLLFYQKRYFVMFWTFFSMIQCSQKYQLQRSKKKVFWLAWKVSMINVNERTYSFPSWDTYKGSKLHIFLPIKMGKCLYLILQSARNWNILLIRILKVQP